MGRPDKNRKEKVKYFNNYADADFETVEGDPDDVMDLLDQFDSRGRLKRKFDKPDWKSIKAETKEKKVKRRKKEMSSTEGDSDRYTLSVQMKNLWEELRQSKTSKERKQELCKELLSQVRGKISLFINAHDTGRVIQTLVAVGGQEYLTHVFEEIKNDIVNLSKVKYSRHIVNKILKYGSKSQKNFIINSIKGKVVKMTQHKIACEVVELAYNDYANAKQRSMMVQEFYGPRFRLFHEDDIKCLDDALKKYPEEKDAILKNLYSHLQPICTKGVFTNSMIHTLLHDYLSHCSPGYRTPFIDTLKENLLPIIHTRDGARVAMICLWHGNSKDRKTILNSFRTHMVKIALEQYGHLVLLAAFDCVDDTVFMNKVVLSELLGETDELVGSDYGMRVLRYLVAPRSPTFFHPCVISVLAQGDGNGNSKKDTDIRQSELQKYSSGPILRLLLGNLKTWAFNPNWTLFIGAALKTLYAVERETILFELAEMLGQTYVPGAEDHPIEVAHTYKMLSFIVKCDQGLDGMVKTPFSSIILKVVKEEQLVGWINSNRGCFLLANMIDTRQEGVSLNLKKLLAPYKEKLADFEYKGAEVLLKKLEQPESEEVKEDPASEDRKEDPVEQQEES